MRTKLTAITTLIITLLFLVTVAAAQPKVAATYGTGPEKFTLATGSPGELGLLKVLGEAFSEQMGGKTTLVWIKAGSGASLKLLKDKKVDMVMVHAPKAEKEAVKQGWATQRTLLGSNEFYIVGPANDPAKIKDAKTAAEAYQRIAKAKAKFFSRGDNSGTHKKEMSIWKKAGIKPKGDWYEVTKDFMTATLKRANAEKGYFMVDSSTWVAEKKNLPNLKVLFKGDKVLVNTYHALAQPKGATPGAATAVEFINFVASPQGQKIIQDYGKKKYGEPLYNDAEYAKKFDH
ncbi:MAG: substrate-binding domain-containing protein [Syntrophobacterales bacterium]|jgi:tungstate transport system substrate-binding protein